MALNEWLNLMLDEVRRKRDERKRAAEEQARREGAAADRNRAGEGAARSARAGRTD